MSIIPKMVDMFTDAKQKTDEERGWPGVEFRANNLDAALAHWIGWVDVVRLKKDFKFPKDVLDLDNQDLKNWLYKQDDTFQQVKKIILDWKQDPDNYKNPYEDLQATPQRIK